MKSKALILNLIRIFFAIYIIALFFYSLGYFTRDQKLWPYKYINDSKNEIVAFIMADEVDRDLTIVEKLLSDLRIIPNRYLKDTVATATDKSIDTSDNYIFKSRRLNPTYQSTISDGAYLVYGFMDLIESEFGLLLISHNGKILRIWNADGHRTGEGLKRALLLHDGAIVTNTTGTLQKLSWCGSEEWVNDGKSYHHELSEDDRGHIWVWGDHEINEINPDDGTILNSISMNDILAANNNNHILEIPLGRGFNFDKVQNQIVDERDERSLKEFKRVTKLREPYHQNDIEPLTSVNARKFPDFNIGDLLISIRTINTIMVIDPETLKIKWSRVGLTSRQHDPDWSPIGKISVFDNRRHNKYSNVTLLDVNTHDKKILVPGEKYNIKMDTLGNATILSDNSILLTDSYSSFLHLSPTGEVLTKFDNKYNENKSLSVLNVFYIEQDKLNQFERSCKK